MLNAEAKTAHTHTHTYKGKREETAFGVVYKKKKRKREDKRHSSQKKNRGNAVAQGNENAVAPAQTKRGKGVENVCFYRLLSACCFLVWRRVRMDSAQVAVVCWEM